MMMYIDYVVCLIVEREAKDAVSWLKAAGFPQYVQMYAGKLNVMDSTSQPVLSVC